MRFSLRSITGNLIPATIIGFFAGIALVNILSVVIFSAILESITNNTKKFDIKAEISKMFVGFLGLVLVTQEFKQL